MFLPAYWAERGALQEIVGGRGSVCVLHTPHGEWMLRHYRRGGMAARLSQDRYIWLGADATRSFREWRLLAHLRDLALPVPAPVAARFQRQGVFYSADLITVRLPGAQTLAQALKKRPLERARWLSIGRTIARFHAHGVHHADLNANNILFSDGEVYLLDFDRGRLRARGPWEAAVIDRLKRSLDKLQRQDPRVTVDPQDWQLLVRAATGEC